MIAIVLNAYCADRFQAIRAPRTRTDSVEETFTTLNANSLICPHTFAAIRLNRLLNRLLCSWHGIEITYVGRRCYVCSLSQHRSCFLCGVTAGVFLYLLRRCRCFPYLLRCSNRFTCLFRWPQMLSLFRCSTRCIGFVAAGERERIQIQPFRIIGKLERP